MKPAYYNELDPITAEWLRNLIAAGLIAPGDVDERSIEDVQPDDLKPYTQCHFFAGIGVWSYALRRAGWPDDRPVWTGSCPCQPFSAAGKGAGFADERHLWPAWHHLIRERRPADIFGEQVASKDTDPWVDLVCADLEALGYAWGGVPFPSASVGAPHIRDRNFWVAHATDKRRIKVRSGVASQGCHGAAGNSTVGRLGHADHSGLEGLRLRHQAPGGRLAEAGSAASAGELGGMADANSEQRSQSFSGSCAMPEATRRLEDSGAAAGLRGIGGPGPVNGFWADADWLFCRDGRWRPVEPGSFPLVDGAPARVVRLRAYGNAINAEAAVAFIEASMRAVA